MLISITRSEEGSQDVEKFQLQIDNKHHAEAFRLFCEGNQFAQRLLSDGTSVACICDPYGDPFAEIPCKNSTELIPAFEQLFTDSHSKFLASSSF